jgi:uncharacterized membrane protein YczE
MNEVLRRDLLKIPMLFLGFVLLSLGMILTMKAGLGMSSWGVLHQGIASVTIFTFGEVTIILGVIILTLSVIFIKTKVGIGTIGNALFIGFIMDFFKEIITYEPTAYLERGVLFLAGLFIMTFGRSLYISTRLGPGPRDGVFVGLSRITQIDVKYVKPTVELTVLTIGFILGGTVGVGTLITMLFSGYLVQFYFKKLGFDPKTEKQRSFKEYFLKKETLI